MAHHFIVGVGNGGVSTAILESWTNRTECHWVVTVLSWEHGELCFIPTFNSTERFMPGKPFYLCCLLQAPSPWLSHGIALQGTATFLTPMFLKVGFSEKVLNCFRPILPLPCNHTSELVPAGSCPMATLMLGLSPPCSMVWLYPWQGMFLARRHPDFTPGGIDLEKSSTAVWSKALYSHFW